MHLQQPQQIKIGNKGFFKFQYDSFQLLFHDWQQIVGIRTAPDKIKRDKLDDLFTHLFNRGEISPTGWLSLKLSPSHCDLIERASDEETPCRWRELNKEEKQMRERGFLVD